MVRRLALLLVFSAMSPALASTDAAWNALDVAARAACTRAVHKMAAKAVVARFAGRVLGIGGGGDQYYGLLLSGNVAGAPGQWLCLYDKHSHKAQVSDIGFY